MHSAHLGSSQLITDYQGSVYEHIKYAPSGEMWIEEKPQGFDYIPIRFTGKEIDRETNLMYYGARYFNPRTSRWMSADPLGSELANPGSGKFSLMEGINWYGYCQNNPVKYIDPTGELSVLEGQPGTVDYFTVTITKKGPVVINGGIEYPNYVSRAIVNSQSTGDFRYLDAILKKSSSYFFGLALSLEVQAAGDEKFRNLIPIMLPGCLPAGKSREPVKTGFMEKLFRRTANINSLRQNPNDPFNYPTNYNSKALQNYRYQIQQNGKLNSNNPIFVRKMNDGIFEIINGHHRWYAAKQMGLEIVPIKIIK